MGLAEIVQQVNAFEHAVARIEANSAHGQADIANRDDEALKRALSDSANDVDHSGTSSEDSEASEPIGMRGLSNLRFPLEKRGGNLAPYTGNTGV